MSIFGKLLKTGLDLALTPVEVVKDIATLGGAITDRHESHTTSKLKQLGRDVEEIRDELDDL